MTWRVFSGSKVTAALCLLLLAINWIAGWAVVSAVREAEQAAHRDLQSRAAAGAHSLMAVLAATRADLSFLSQSPALAELRAVLSERDPMVRRWRRLDIESTLLLFLDSQPEVEELRILGPDGKGVVAAGRRGGAPVLTASEVEMQPGHRPHGDDLISSFPLPGTPPAGILEAVVHVDTLLAGALPAAGAHLIRGPQLQNSRHVLDAVVVPVFDPGWEPEVKWAPAFPENRGFFDSLGKLGTRYRSTLAANLLLILLVGFFGILSIRQARAWALLEAEYRRQQEVRALERQVLHNERLAGIGRLAAGFGPWDQQPSGRDVELSGAAGERPPGGTPGRVPAVGAPSLAGTQPDSRHYPPGPSVRPTRRCPAGGARLAPSAGGDRGLRAFPPSVQNGLHRAGSAAGAAAGPGQYRNPQPGFSEFAAECG